MLRIVMPVDGSKNSDRAVRYLISLAEARADVEVHMLNVQESANAWEVRRFLKEREIRQLQLQHGEQQLQSAKRLLQRAGVRHDAHVLIGDVAGTIARFASRRRCDVIIMGTRGMGSVPNLLLGSIATKVVHLSRVPVTLVK